MGSRAQRGSALWVQQYASAPMDANTAAAWRDLYIGIVGAGASLTERRGALLGTPPEIEGSSARPSSDADYVICSGRIVNLLNTGFHAAIRRRHVRENIDMGGYAGST